MPRPTLLMLHGFPHDHALWTEQMEGLSDLAEVIAPDLLGFGTGGAVPDVLTMEDYAADVKALLDARGIERVVLGGLSMGGYVALAFLQRWPEGVQGLLLINTRATADALDARAAREATAMEVLANGTSVLARAMLPRVLSEKTRREKPDVVAHVRSMMERQDPRAVAAAARGMARRPDRSFLLPGVRVPALVITGAEDELMPLPTSQAMAEAIPGARLVVIPGVAHLSNMEDADHFNYVVRDFLRMVSHP
ncbi:MAG: alpha/beta fold hydrolase [Flavobacteriales bacterium]|nr:alpha/beta fold hydrolase [Flavobacteriales bacterium]